MEGRIIQNMFSTRNKKTHDDLRRPMQRLYSLPNVLTYEPQVDQMVEYFVKKLDGYCEGRPTVDVGRLVLYCITLLLPKGHLDLPDLLLQSPSTSSVPSHSVSRMATWRKNVTLTGY
jgi:hypothetical protein